jgi:hypothetical protein
MLPDLIGREIHVCESSVVGLRASCRDHDVPGAFSHQNVILSGVGDREMLSQLANHRVGHMLLTVGGAQERRYGDRHSLLSAAMTIRELDGARSAIVQKQLAVQRPQLRFRSFRSSSLLRCELQRLAECRRRRWQRILSCRERVSSAALVRQLPLTGAMPSREMTMSSTIRPSQPSTKLRPRGAETSAQHCWGVMKLHLPLAPVRPAAVSTRAAAGMRAPCVRFLADGSRCDVRKEAQWPSEVDSACSDERHILSLLLDQ